MISRPRRRQPQKESSSERDVYRLRIDTTGDVGEVALINGRDHVVERRVAALDRHSPGVLEQAMTSLLHARHLATADLRGIDVVPGPGRFSRVRLGVVTANALSWALGIPLTVRGKRARIARPEYGAEPHIG